MHASDLPDIQTLGLQKPKIAVERRIGTQVMADMQLRKEGVLEDATKDMMLVLESKVLAHDDGTAEQEVYVDVEVGVSWRQIFSFLFGGKRTIKDRVPVKVKARKWTTFPENDIPFPSNLGRQVVKVQTWVGDE